MGLTCPSAPAPGHLGTDREAGHCREDLPRQHPCPPAGACSPSPPLLSAHEAHLVQLCRSVWCVQQWGIKGGPLRLFTDRT